MKEIWDVLDEAGNKTGKQIVKGEQLPQGMYHLGVDVWIINSSNQILIQKRSSNKKLSPNVWAMTGGSNISGETSLQTIQREAKEELGINLNMDNIKLVKKFKTGKVWVDTYFVMQNVNLKDIVMQEDEVSDVKWASFEEVETLVNDNQFIENRWEFIKDEIKKQIQY